MMIWRSPLTLEELNAGRSGTILEHIGVEFTQIGDDFVRGIMPVDGRTRQPYGLLHGGASVALAESLGSTGATMCIDTQQYQCVGQEINANHLRAVTTGTVTATARPYHLGARSHLRGVALLADGSRRRGRFSFLPETIPLP
jgi:1,4-dihydroxy-2-naphthoyl-CoA hydrolase